MDYYAHEKLRELEQKRLDLLSKRPRLESPRRKPVFGPLAAAIGGRLRRFGEELECWANPPACEPKRPFRFDRY
jgi:hypothetical protein